MHKVIGFRKNHVIVFRLGIMPNKSINKGNEIVLNATNRSPYWTRLEVNGSPVTFYFVKQNVEKWNIYFWLRQKIISCYIYSTGIRVWRVVLGRNSNFVFRDFLGVEISISRPKFRTIWNYKNWWGTTTWVTNYRSARGGVSPFPLWPTHPRSQNWRGHA